jgi:hypothetical protein
LPLIWCSISGHGFGHAAQVVPVLNHIGQCVPDITVILNTSVAPSFFEPRLTIPWRLNPTPQDIGCVQDGPLRIDVPATWEAHRRFHMDWESRIQTEAAVIKQSSPALVLSDISHMAVAAGASAGVPTVALCSLSWDTVLELYERPGVASEQHIVQHIRRAYAGADCLIRPTPGVPVTAFRRVADVGPICEPHRAKTTELRAALDVPDADCLVLVGFGGISQKEFPFAALESMAPFRFIIDADVPPNLTRVISIRDLAWPFHTVLASADVIVTKPGYGTIVEAVALQKPVVYVRRYHFVDEQSLVDYLHRYGRGIELDKEAFVAGAWRESLIAARESRAPLDPPPAPTGGADAASLLMHYFR